MTDDAQASSRCQADVSACQVSRPQPGQPASFQQSSTPALPTVRQWFNEPQAWRWYYYDPTQTRQMGHPGPSTPPHTVPSTSPAPPDPKHAPSSTTSTSAGTPLATPPADPTHSLVVASLNALQFQFATFRDSLNGAQLDLKDALAQLHFLRTAHTKTDKSIAELESVVGVDGMSTASARSRGRTRRGRARGRGGKTGVTAADAPLDDEGSAADTAPERKTLVQSMAAIQAQIEALLARDGRTSDPYSLNPSTDPVRLALPLPSIADPLRHLTVPNPATSSASRPSELASPPFPIVIPTPESATSLPLAVPAKEYADASIQACSPSSTSESSCSLLNAHRHVPGLVPVDWSSATHGRYGSSLVRPTAFTAECLALFVRDAHLHSAPNSATDSQTPRSNLSPLQGKPVANNLGVPRAEPDTSSSTTLPSADGSTCTTEVSSRPASISIQSSHLQALAGATEGADCSMILPQTEQPGGSQTLSPSLLTFLSGSTRDTLDSKQLRAETDDSEDARMPFDAEGDSTSAPIGPKLAFGTTPAMSDDRRESAPVAADEGGLPSSVATPPSETVNVPEPQVTAATRSMTGHFDAGLGPMQALRPRPAVDLPIAPTRPSLTPEPSMGEDRGGLVGLGDTDARSPRLSSPGMQAPMTPPLFYPNLADGELLTGESARNMRVETGAHMGVEKHTCSLSEGNAAAGVTNLTYAPRPAGDVDVPTTPRSSANHPGTKPSALDLDADDVTGSTYSLPQNACGYDIRFSSPLRCPSPSATPTTPPSRYATPTEPTDAMCLAATVEEEDELWRALMPGSGSGSDASTPLSLARMLSPDEPLPWASLSTVVPCAPLLEQTSVDPYVLHDSPPLSVLPVNGRAPWREGGGSPPRILEGSSSPLTSLGEMTDVDERARAGGARAGTDDTGADTMPHDSSKIRTPISTPRKIAQRGSGRKRRSEAFNPGSPRIARAASEATMVDAAGFSPSSPWSRRVVGGPSASLDELVILARRKPLKIHLRIPEGMRGVKRKRDVDVSEGEEAMGMALSVNDERRQVADREGNLEEVARRGDTPPVRTVDVSALNTRTPTSTVSRLALKSPTSDGEMAEADAPECSTGGGVMDTAEDRPSDSPVSRKRTRKETERGKAYVQVHHTKPKQRQEITLKSPASVHVRNGQPVTVGPCVPTSATRPEEEADQDAQTRMPTRMHQENGQENRAMKTPLSPQCPGQSSWRSPRGVKLSTKKEDEWDAISRSGRTWPQLPPTFDQWDCQFIQCDNCDKWYHYGCVGVKPGDPRLKPAILFICPTCHAQSARRQTLRNQNDTCARPDCPQPQLTQESGLFFIERLVGRKKTEGHVYMWLAKWEGYPMTEATWIPRENVVGDDEKLFNLFIRDAIEEGVDLSQDVILLQEAMNAGWASET